MSFRFDPTEEYSIIVRLWFVAKEFLQFMCYRKNVFLPTADLSTPADEGKTRTKEIQKLIDNSTGDLKRKYKFLRKLISSNSLQSEVVHVGNKLGEIIDLFGKRLYSMNDTDLLYSEMGKRLADQRNNYAHGNLDIDFIDKSLIDLVYTERIVYAMQLKHYGVETKNIQNAINELFRCGVIIR